MLAMYVEVEHNIWDAILSYITFTYNTAGQGTMCMTPFKLVYGKSPA